MATYEELMNSAEQIRTNELPESNTHELVGKHLKNQVEYFNSQFTTLERTTVYTTDLDITLIESGSSITEAQQLKIDAIFNTNKPVYCINKGFYTKQATDIWSKQLSLWYNDTLYFADMTTVNWQISKKSFYTKEYIDKRLEEIKAVNSVTI